VLGAGVSSLMVMLSKEYLVLLAVANLLAIPTIFYWGNSWLDNYAFKTDLGVELFFIPGIVICIIALATVSYRTYFAAQANPVDSLRKE
jgi:putative ABC transport system permease protein